MLLTKILFATDNCNSTLYVAENTHFPSITAEYRPVALCGESCEGYLTCSNSVKLLPNNKVLKFPIFSFESQVHTTVTMTNITIWNISHVVRKNFFRLHCVTPKILFSLHNPANFLFIITSFTIQSKGAFIVPGLEW